ncbi:MAG: HAMP domain-containing protein [Veillonellaceae bacterium]|nr:HAMP domain-containing protein [Veillonellaceae bacterium]
MKLTSKMIAYFLVVVLISFVGFVYSIFKVTGILDDTRNTQNVEMPRFYQTTDMTANTMAKVAQVRGYLLTGSDVYLQEYDRLAKIDTETEKALLAIMRTDKGKKLTAELLKLDTEFNELVEKKLVPLKKAGKDAEALQLNQSEVAPAAKVLGQKMEEYKVYRQDFLKGVFARTIDNATDTRNAVVLSMILSVLVGILIGIFAARSIVRPVKTIVAYLEEVANGNLSERSHNIATQDEIRQLADEVVKMTHNLRNLIRQINSNAEQLAASSEELTASAEQSAQASNQVAVSMTEVAAGANAQLASATDASAVVEEMSAGIEQIAANAGLVAGQSEQAREKAKDGGTAVDKAVQQMSRIEQTVNSSAAVVAKLGERSKEIGQIVDAIAGIAGQTNLLALNAAIEAARAGEQGRGFAVVAEEVRKLAEQSEEAAQRISGLIGEIQADTDMAVGAMNNGTREVKTGAEVVNAAGASFREIADLVAEVSDQIKQMSAAIEQMATGSQQIVGSVKKIDDLSKKSAEEAESVSAATEEQLASMEEISTSSRALATLAQELQTAVSKFRI